MIKLTDGQKRAFNKLTNEWQSGYVLQEDMNILDSLVRLAKAETKKEEDTFAFPNTNIKYRLLKKRN